MKVKTEQDIKHEVQKINRKYFKKLGHKLELVRHGMQYQLNVMDNNGFSVYQTFGNGDIRETSLILSGVTSTIKFIQSHQLNSEISANLQSTYASCNNAIEGEWDKSEEGFIAMQECLNNSAAAISKLTGTDLIFK